MNPATMPLFSLKATRPLLSLSSFFLRSGQPRANGVGADLPPWAEWKLEVNMNDSLVWIPCQPRSEVLADELVSSATHLAFRTPVEDPEPWVFYDGFLWTEEKPSLRPVLLRVLRRSASSPPSSAAEVASFRAGPPVPGIVSPRGVVLADVGVVVVSPFVNGLLLSEIQRRLRVRGNSIPLESALEIVWQLLAILDRVDAPGQRLPESARAHGSIRPSSISIGVDGRLRLLDMGADLEIKRKERRAQGKVAASILPYLAPEQLVDEKAATVQTDMYAVATIAYELVSGKPLFNGSAARRELEIRAGFGVESKLLELDQTAPGLAEVLQKALHTRMEDRYPSVRAMLEAVDTLRAGPPTETLGNLVHSLKTFRPSLGNGSSASGQGRGRDPADERAGTHSPHGGRAPGNSRSPRTRLESARERRLRLVVGLVGMMVAAAAYAWVTETPPDPAHHVRIDSALQADRAPAELLEGPGTGETGSQQRN